MDSLTQIVLGAACGEAALGKKIGNRAMLWGAIGGTIPDLDVLGNFMMTEMESLAFHRGISHSFFFACTMPFLFAWLADRFYKSGLYRKDIYKISAFVVWMLLLVLIAFGVNYIPIAAGNQLHYPTLIISIGLISWMVYSLYSNYLKQDLESIDVRRKEWLWLFFLSIFTHPLLDAFTAYGTQLFAPFSNYRVAFNTISVVDPLYTIPFLACLLVASFIRRNRPMRRYVNFLGILLSSAYLLFTVFNKQRIDRVFEYSLQVENIDYQRFRTSPSILNNILWQGLAETDSLYYYGMYSLLDKEPKVYQFYTVSKNHDLIKKFESDKSVQVLKWFTDGYYNVIKLSDNTYQLSDLRYGARAERPARPEDYVFRFILEPTPEGLKAYQTRDVEGTDEAIGDLFERIKGK